MEDGNLDAEGFREKITNLLSTCYASSNVKTKQQFAGELGTNYLQLYRWMEGKTIPRKEALKKICDVCHVDFLTFMSLDGNEEFPHKKLNLASLGKAYERAETLGDREDRELVVILASTLVYNLLKYLGVSLSLSSTDGLGDNICLLYTSPSPRDQRG